jgi:hypothetical protein
LLVANNIIRLFQQKRSATGEVNWPRLELGKPANGGAGEIRTPDTWFRKPMLYPSELQPLDKVYSNLQKPVPQEPGVHDAFGLQDLPEALGRR